MLVAVLPAAFVLGVGLRRRDPVLFRRAFRAHLLVLASSLTFAAGMTVEVGAGTVAGVGVLMAGELLALALGVVLAARGRVHPVAATSGSSNSGFWSIPVAGAVFGPAGAAFATIYDTLGAARALVLVHILRRHAQVRLRGGSALVDYSPQLALAVAVVLRLMGVRLDLAVAVPILAVLTGAAGFALLGMAMPDRWPGRTDWAAASPSVALRFVIPALLCTAVTVAGVTLPPPVWVVALAPTPFAVVSFAALYGYPRSTTAAIPLLTLPVAAGLLAALVLVVR